MPLIKCPDCEKMISDRAASCPFCGCPAEFFEESIEESNMLDLMVERQEISTRSQNEIKFRFGNNEFRYLEEDAGFIRALSHYLQVGEMTGYIVDKAYDELGSIGAVLRNVPKAVEIIIQEDVLDFTIGLLYSMGYSMSIQQFVQKYEDKYIMQYEPYYTDIVEKYAKIRQEEAQLADYRRAAKNARGRWVGGGFGVKGAVKGAITAGILNCGTDFLHSFGDAAEERKDSREIQKKLRELYENPETKSQLVEGIKICILNIAEAMQSEMHEIGILSPEIEISYEKALTLYNNTIKWESDRDTYYKNIAQCIAYYPVKAEFYEKIQPAIEFYEENDISRFIEFWGFDKVILSMDGWEDEKISFEDWKIKRILEYYYEKYKGFQPSEVIRREKEKALQYQKGRKKEEILFANNIRRRFGALIENITESSSIINLPLYVLKPESRPTSLVSSDKMDEFVFWDNGEIVITDYTFIMDSTTVEIKQINEIWYGEANKNGKFPIQIMLKKGKETDTKQCSKQSTISVLTLLNVALYPYREIEYITKFDSTVRDFYVELMDDANIKAIDSASDKKKKEKIEEQCKKNSKLEVEKYILESRSEEEKQFSASIRRRFQLLLNLDLVQQEHIINKYIYELEAENKIIPNMIRKNGFKPDEFLFYSDKVWAITDYALYINDKYKNQIYIKLEDINEIYFSDSMVIAVTLKKNSISREQLKAERISINIECEIEELRDEIIFLLNLVLEVYRESDYIQEIQDVRYLWLWNYRNIQKIIENFERENGDFEEYIINELDDELDRKKRLLLSEKAEERMADRKKIAESFRKKNVDPVKDKFAADFASLFMRFLEISDYSFCNIKYFNRFLNHYEYEVYEHLPKDVKKCLSEMPEKGQRILWFSKDIVLTDHNIRVKGQIFNLFDIKEILLGETVEAWEADSFEDWIDTDERCVIKFKNGEIQCIKDGNDSDFLRIEYPFNYTLKTLHNENSVNLFVQKEVFFCEKCNSFKISIAEGLLGKKYRCSNCNNKSKRKIIVFESDDKEELYQKVASEFMSKCGQELDLRKNMHTEKSIVICKHCGKEIAKEAKFCNFCGNSVSIVKEEQLTVGKSICRFCGKEILAKAKFCNFCGEPNK